MSTFQPITPNWLTGVWDEFIKDDPELQNAYDYTDYPSDLGGEGNWVDLYLTDSNEFPVGRLWVNPETENIGLQELQFGNISYLTKIALQLREFNYHEVGVLPAYDFIRNQYYADEQQTGDLANARIEASAV
jgi:hypothetical protein